MTGATARPITLLHVFSTFAIGGPQMRFAILADRLGPKYRHLIMSMSGQIDAASLLRPGLSYEVVAIRNSRRNSVANVLRFAQAIRRIDPDLLVTYNWGALEWAIANRFGPRISHVHVEDGFGPDEAALRFRRRAWLRRLGLGCTTKAVVVPSRNLERIAHSEWRLPAARICYLPNGVDTVRFGAAVPEAKRAFTKQPGELVVGTCAALRPEKNLARLIRAFAACGARNARLVICGDGPERQALERVAAATGVSERVVFTGYVAKPETALANFDVFAMSSDTEQMPLGLLEGMAAGLPAAGTDVGDTRSVVADENKRFIVPVADSAALTGTLRALLADAALRAKLGAANQAKARAEFSIDTMIAAYDRLFEDAGRR